MGKSFRICIIVIAIGSALAPALRGQATSSAISGVVRDASQAVIAGAGVTVLNVETGISRATTSNSTGFYRVGELLPGSYSVTVTMPGFNRGVRPDIILEVGREISVNITLQVGAVEQEVVVTGEAPMVETTISSVATNVTQEQLQELPLNGRAFTDLVTLNPGAIAPHVSQGRGANYGFSNQLSVAGARTDSNSFRIDGTDVMDTRNQNPGSAAGVQLGVDTIREFQVVTTNGKAEYGRNAGAVVNAVSRSGTNDMHGSLFEFLRNSAMDSAQFEDVDGIVPPFKRNQFGGTVGGPIVRDKSFFFLGYEGLRQRLNQTAVWNVPSAQQKQGIGVGNNGADVEVDPRIVPYLDLYPLPNVGTRFVADESVPTTENFGSARVDFHLSENAFLFGRYTISRADASSISTLLSNQESNTDRQFLTIQEDHIITPALLNMFRFGFNRTIGFSAPGQVPGGENLGFAPGVPMGQISAGPDASDLGPNGIGIVDDKQTAFQFEDNITYTTGPHTMKFGAMFQRFRWDTDNPAFWQGDFSFPNLVQMLTLQTVDPTFRLPESRTRRDIRTWLMAFFVQDDYRVTPNLTLNLGFRWEFTTGMNEANGDVSYLAKGPHEAFYDATDPFSETDDVIEGELWRNHIKNFEPRIGFNWAMGPEQLTSLSGGFGIYHNQILHNSMVSFRDQLPLNFRANARGLNANAAFPDIEAVVRTSGQLFDATRHFDYENFKTPTLYRYNLTVQHQLPGEMALKVGYVGSIGRHLARRQLLNVFPDPILVDGEWYFPPSSEAPQEINPNFGRIEWMSSDVNSTYNSLTASLQKRFSRGVMFQANYTWSKSLDDYSQSETNFSGEANANAQYGPDRSLDRALSSFNSPHVFVFNGIYELPFGMGRQFMNTDGVANAIFGGWQIGGILTLQQGLPFTIGSNISDSRAGFAWRADRPSLAPGADVGSIVTGNTPDSLEQVDSVKYFDVNAFVKPDRGRVGNAARNLLIGPDLRNVNFTVSKFFEISEMTRLQFRAEFFNLFNRHNFRNPAARVFTSRGGGVPGSAGTITETLDNSAREVQLGLKLTF